MLSSLEIYNSLNSLGYTLESGKKNRTYALEHHLGSGEYVYVKGSTDKSTYSSPLVIHEKFKDDIANILNIKGITLGSITCKSTAYRNFPKNGSSNNGISLFIENYEALKSLLEYLKPCRKMQSEK